MPIDLNQAPEQRDIELIPDDTIAAVHVTIRPGGDGDGGWLKRSKNGDSYALDLEFTVIDGPFAKRKFWSLFTVEGESEGHNKARDISFGRLRGMVESAYGVKPDDMSAQAKKLRNLSSFAAIDNLRCLVKVGLELGKDGYKDRNTFEAAITPNKPQWRQIEQLTKPDKPAPSATSQQSRTVAGKVPSWAIRQQRKELPDDDIPF